MSFFTQAAKKRNFGMSFMSNQEKQMRGLPWNRCRAWHQRKEAIKKRVAKRVARATSRRVARELEAKKQKQNERSR